MIGEKIDQKLLCGLKGINKCSSHPSPFPWGEEMRKRLLRYARNDDIDLVKWQHRLILDKPERQGKICQLIQLGIM